MMLRDKMSCAVTYGDCFLRVSLMFQPYYLVPCCQGKLGELATNRFQNLLCTVQFILSLSNGSFINRRRTRSRWWTCPPTSWWCSGRWAPSSASSPWARTCSPSTRTGASSTPSTSASSPWPPSDSETWSPVSSNLAFSNVTHFRLHFQTWRELIWLQVILWNSYGCISNWVLIMEKLLFTYFSEYNTHIWIVHTSTYRILDQIDQQNLHILIRGFVLCHLSLHHLVRRRWAPNKLCPRSRPR